ARVDRLLLMLGSAWHVVGPVLVLALTEGVAERAPVWSEAGIYVGALAAQIAFDFVSSSARDWLGLGISPRSRVGFMSWVSLVDAALAPVGLLVAFAAYDRPYLILLVLPLVGLL